MIANHGLMERWSQAIVRKAASLQFPMDASWLRGLVFGPSRTTYNYAADVQEGLTSSVVMPPIQFIMRAFPEAPLVMRRQHGDDLEVEPRHPLVELVNRPNDAYPGTILWMATIYDWCWAGESFWRILTSRGGRPGQLWWVPPWSIKPKWPDDGSVFISHYEYQPSIGEPIRLEPEEVIHFRHGIDPWNMRHGLPPLRAILQDIWTDGESGNFVAAMLRNMGVPGIILSPKGEAYLSQEDVERVKLYIQSRFTGDQRGQPLALGTPTSVEKLSLSPTELDMSRLRNTAEERVCSALGIPAAVVGFGTGLANSKVGATMHEFVGLAWSNGIVPMQRLMAAELQRRLLPLFETDLESFLLGWDYDEVKALEPDQNELAKRAVDLFQGGILMRAESRQLMGYEANDGDEIYLVPSSMTEEGPDAPEPDPLPVNPPPASQVALGSTGQGNGNGSNGNGNRVAVQQRALKQGTTEEFINGIIGRQVQRLERPPQSAVRLANRLWRDDQKAQPQFQRMIADVLRQYGSRARLAAKEILFPQKQDLSYLTNVGIIQERMPVASIQAELAEVYAKMYEVMLGLTLEAIKDALDVEVTNPARIAAQLSNLARERVGLLDLSNEARSAILRTLEEAQAAGLDEDAVLKLLEDRIPAGRWGSVETRARIIARTEGRLASNISTSQAAQDMRANLLVFDSRLGSFDAPCDERVGWIVTPAQAQALSAVEHVSGTLSFAVLTPAMTPSATI